LKLGGATLFEVGGVAAALRVQGEALVGAQRVKPPDFRDFIRSKTCLPRSHLTTFLSWGKIEKKNKKNSKF
jgi:hypothetical protein